MSEMIDPFIKSLDQVAAPKDAPSWLAKLRNDGAESYRARELPHVKLEAWKYTNLKALKSAEISLAERLELNELPNSVPEIDAYRIVLVNGRFDACLSDLADLPGKLVVKGLAQAIAEGDVTGIGELFGQEDALVSLSDALLDDGAYIALGRGVMLEKPIHLVSIASGGEGESFKAVQPRILIDVADGANGVLLESHVSDGAAITVPVTEIKIAERAHLGHYKQQIEGAESFHLATTAAHVAEGAEYDSFVLQLGARVARSDVRCEIAGSHADIRVNGAYHAGNGQHIDNTSFIDHAAPESNSAENFRGVMDGDGRGVFQGKILVRQIAQQTDGQQMNRALLLSPKAEIDSKPELEIYADDVKCSHGATTGDMDEDQLFYLKARGIDDATARQMLIQAFLFEVLEDIQYEPARDLFHQAIADKLGEIE